ncbi:MAG: hypothetical protein LBP70_00435 [Mycoplasmataceae bacterium]|jgi:RNA polymerase sigma factor (sigma-70 family)|nr:hypothetical protein [Mycoplasmataceae bacterium]
MSENQLIKQYQLEKNLLIRDQLFAQYRQILNALTVNLVKNLFPNVPLEKEDFISYTYFSFIKCLETFNTEQNKYTFTQALATINRSMIIRYASRMLRNGERVLNVAYSLLPSHEYQASYSSETEINHKLEIELEIKKLMQYVQRYPKSVQAMVQMKIHGYSNKEIATHLHVKNKKVANTFLMISKNYRKYLV